LLTIKEQHMAVTGVLAFGGIVVALVQPLVVPLISDLPALPHASTADATWVITATLLAGAVATPVVGRLGDMFGKRLMLPGSPFGPSSNLTWGSARSSAPRTRSGVSTRGSARPSGRGHFPTDQAALKCVYLAVMSLGPTSTGRKRWTMRWKAALQAFDITFDGRLTAGRR
jgi:hypothetical protein